MTLRITVNVREQQVYKCIIIFVKLDTGANIYVEFRSFDMLDVIGKMYNFDMRVKNFAEAYEMYREAKK